MGSQTDWATLKAAADMLDTLGVPYESKIVSAHRTPQRLYDYATTAAKTRPEKSSSPGRAARRICRA